MVLSKIFVSRNERLLRGYRKQVNQINGLEAELNALSDSALAEKTNEFKARFPKAKAFRHCCQKLLLW